ncbi:hypothetical protein EXIGLDRAFT_763031 [Exidia glandulosa HHB12029]|uniref:Hemimethylated DNA-binding domain-containing protein n=1 Tax=Exidia glandulosa HHB12029 TaxID=1314781 RepID=A0A165MBL2_EXIGL|nr:hypothetical protein EXIGLDRAFT_763031 [Exidia glandulosa HHB12029]
MLDRLPPELVEHVCASFSVDDGVGPLCALQATCKSLRAVASLSLLWHPHYTARWPHSSPEQEESRRRRYASDYCQMYAARARTDNSAGDLLDDIINDRASRPARAVQFANDLGRDVWDYLVSQAHQDGDVRLCGGKDSYVRRYWARQALGVIARLEVVVGALLSRPVYDHLTLEAAVTDMSAWWGHDTGEIQAIYDQLAWQCRESLVIKEVAMPQDSGFRATEFCTHVCNWMRDEGFRAAPEEQYTLLMNHFAHSFLKTHRRTLPMSLIIVFLAITSRLGLHASPVAFPYQVIVRVHTDPPGLPTDSDFFVDVYSTESPSGPIVPRDRLLSRLSQMGISDTQREAYLKPSPTGTMVQRVANNILNSINMPGQATQSQHDRAAALYVALCTAALTNLDPDARVIGQLVELGREHFPLDIRPVVQRGIAKALRQDSRNKLNLMCEARLQEAKAPVKPAERSERIQYAVGQIVFHRRWHYWGVIRAWDHSCQASEAWVHLMDVDRLPGGRDQPFYRVYALLDDSQPERYVANCNIVPLHTCPKEADCPVCPVGVNPHPPPLWDLVRDVLHANSAIERYFTHVEPGWMGRARFVMSPELREIYPHDDEFAARAIASPPPLVEPATV